MIPYFLYTLVNAISNSPSRSSCSAGDRLLVSREKNVFNTEIFANIADLFSVTLSIIASALVSLTLTSMILMWLELVSDSSMNVPPNSRHALFHSNPFNGAIT